MENVGGEQHNSRIILAISIAIALISLTISGIVVLNAEIQEPNCPAVADQQCPVPEKEIVEKKVNVQSEFFVTTNPQAKSSESIAAYQGVEIYKSTSKTGWTTYKNSRLNFEVSFPSDWRIEDLIKRIEVGAIIQKLELVKGDELIHIDEGGYGLFPEYTWQLKKENGVYVVEKATKNECPQVEGGNDVCWTGDKGQISMNFENKLYLFMNYKKSSESQELLKEIIKTVKLN